MKKSSKSSVLSLVLLIMIGVGFINFSCSYADSYGNSTTTTPNTDSSANNMAAYQVSTTVIIKNFTFNPASVTIKPGTQVTWINNDSMIHNIVIGKTTSPDLSNGRKWSQTFYQIGIFQYKCGFHASMTGTIVVK
jgi:plastocyanin